MSRPLPAGDREYHTIERQRGRLVTLGGFLLTMVCATLVLVSSWSGTQGLDLPARWPALVGLFGLVLLFVLHAQKKHRELSAMERRLRESAVRAASLEARFTELSFLFDLSTQLQLRLDLSGILDLAAQRLITCLDASQCSILLKNEETGTLEVRAAAGADTHLVANARVEPGEGIAGHVFQSGESLILTPEVMERRFPGEIKRDRTIRSALSVPLKFRGTPIGVVNVTRSAGEPFAEVHARMLEVFAEHCAATVVKTRHHHDVLRQVSKAA